MIFLLFQFRHVTQTQVAFTPLCWLIFLITSTFASMFSVFQKRRSTREWHLPIVIMEGKNLMDRESCLSTVRELRCLIRGTWVSSIATSILRSQLIKISIASYKYKLRSQVLELRWKKELRCPLRASVANCARNRKTPLKNVEISRHFSCIGSIDPWHALSVLSNLTTSEVAIFIPGTSHCANMDPDYPEDPPALTAARKVRHVILYDR